MIRRRGADAWRNTVAENSADRRGGTLTWARAERGACGAAAPATRHHAYW